MSDEETTVETTNEAPVDISVDTVDNTTDAEPTTLFDQVKTLEADEVKDDAEVELLKLQVIDLGVDLENQRGMIASLAHRVFELESAAPVAANEKLEALVAKMHEKMKLLIPMD